MNILGSYGYVEDFLRDPRDYIFGSSVKMPVINFQEDGNWEPWLPKYEPQAERYETNACTVWGTQNALETIYKRIYGIEPNYSERFNAILIGLDGKTGTNPNLPCESVRNDGVIDQSELPVTKTLKEFFTPKPMTGSLLAKGQYWLGKHQFMHEWVWDTKPENWKELLREALKTSPIGVSVTAWRRENGLYVSDNGGNNHWCLLYRIDDDGTMWVFDSYDHSKKPLHPDHNIRRAKRFFVNRTDIEGLKKQLSLLQALLNLLLMKKTLLDVCKAHLGTDASPNDLTKDETACAETMTTLLKKVYPQTPIITGTWTLWEYLKNPKNGWVPSSGYSPETIILSPTGTGKAGTTGHVGIFLEDGLIASNDSRTGKFIQNYTLNTWQARYRDKQGMPIYLFHKV
jgi:hypothetical protein